MYQMNYYNRKSPAAAFWLSFFIPGLGQVYNGQAGKGLAMLTIDVVAACMISKYTYTHNDYNYYNEQPRTNSIVYFSIATSLFVSVWSMIDATSSAKEINRLNGLSSFNYKLNKNANLTFKPDFRLDGLGRGEINPVMGAKLSLNMQ